MNEYDMSPTKSATTEAQLVSETDYVELSRLVVEHGWRTDNGRRSEHFDIRLNRIVQLSVG